MKTDIEIAENAKMKNIEEICEQLNIKDEEFERYGKYIGKLNLDVYKNREDKKDGKLILLTAINPTPMGEGKTTLNIGLSMALNKINKSAISTLREPSLGPSFGLKGGATGGGYSQVLPMVDINLHFTGDFHAITYANNLISTIIDNHIHQGNKLGIDPKRIYWKRCIDLNDRTLRNIVIGLGDKNGIVREDGFNITVASEMMAILCLSKNLKDLKERLNKIIIGYKYNGKPVYLEELNCVGAVATLLKDAIKPNIVQTIENTPAIIHGGPFANIAHGCNSVIATKTALKLSDYVVTEAGFGADLGGEKFLNIKARCNDLKPDCVVIVATIKALKMHGGMALEDINKEGLSYLKKGFSNLKKHMENIDNFGLPFVVAINKYDSDTDKEIELLENLIDSEGHICSLTEVWKYGSDGAIDLARKVVDLSNNKSVLKLTYDDEDSIESKIEKVCKNIYGAKDISISPKARMKLKEIDELGLSNLPICIAKTQYSLSDDKKKLGRPENFTINIKDLEINSGAGFIVVLTGNVMRMPGLSKNPQAEKIDIDYNGHVTGLL